MEENVEQEAIEEPKQEVKEKYCYDETDEQIKIDKVYNVNHNKGAYKTLICVIIVAIIVGVISSLLTTPTVETYVISGTDIEINTTSDQLLYDTKEELIQYFGEEYAYYYTFAIVEKDSSEYELYGTLINKSELGEEYDLNSLIQADRDYVAGILGEEITSQVSEIKLGEKDFKTYNYKDSKETSGEYIVAIYIADVGEQYLLIEGYADSDLEVTKVNNIMTELFK